MARHSFRPALVAFALLIHATAAVASGHARATASGSLFASDGVLELTIRAPFNRLFQRAKDDAKYAVRAGVSYADAQTGRDVVLDDVELTVRGNTSRRDTECSFPKLRLKFGVHGQVEASLFAGNHVVKVGTHCGEMPDGALMPAYGRWANEKGAHREALVYRLIAAVGLPTLRVRAARITYVYSDPRPGQLPDQAKPVVRDAFLLEDDEVAERRLGATGRLKPPVAETNHDSHATAGGVFANAARDFTPAASARVAFAEAMVGNFDWAMKANENDSYRSAAKRGLWNVLALVAPGGAFPLIYDFDLSGMVTGRHMWFGSVFSREFLPSASERQIEVFAQVQRARSLFPREVLDGVRHRFLAARQRVYDTLSSAPVDDDGRRFATTYLDAFYWAIERDDAFYVPVVAREGVVAFADPGGTHAACGSVPVPIGTPVRRREGRAANGTAAGPVPLLTRGTARLVSVELLDVHWRFAESSPSRCDAVRRGVVWIDETSIDANYPAGGQVLR